MTTVILGLSIDGRKNMAIAIRILYTILCWAVERQMDDHGMTVRAGHDDTSGT